MSPRRIVGLPLLLVAALSCKRASPPQATTEGTTGATQEEHALVESELVQAHRDALARLIPPATDALRLSQPVVAGIAGLAPLRGPGWFGTRRSQAQAALDPLVREAREIDGERLEPTDVQVLISLRFALDRAHRTLEDPYLAFDPTWITRNIATLLDEIEHRQLTSGCAEDCAEALRDAVFGLQGSQAGLQRTSAALLDGAIADLTTLEDRMTRLQRIEAAIRTDESTAETPMRGAIESLRGELARARTTWISRRDGLADLEPRPWTALMKSRLPAENFRLPDVIDHLFLRRILGRQEHVEDPPDKLLASASRNLARLRAMRTLTKVTGQSRATALTLERCRSLYARLQEAVSNASPGPFSCDAFVAFAEGEGWSDDAVLMEMLDHTVVLPVRRTRRAALPPHVQLVTGEMAPRAHRWITLIGYAHAASLRGVEALAIDGAARSLCRASAALLQHGRAPVRSPLPGEPRNAVPVHTRDTGLAWLKERCPETPAETLWTLASRDPWDAVSDGGMVLLNDEPYIMAGLDAFWWTPLGLTIPFAIPNPERRAAPQPSAPEDDKVRVTVENL